MTLLVWALVLAPVGLLAYAYVIYPLLLMLGVRGKRREPFARAPGEWPQITITIPAYNEEGSIRASIESVLALDYPGDRRQILVISDASTDRTDDIVREYAARGVELLRLPHRGGKTAAENEAGRVARGAIIVNTDASVRILPESLKALIRAFDDPTVGVASGRDVSVGDTDAESNGGESGYVGYEMSVRALETRLGSIVGASGCFYGIRREIHDTHFPEQLSRDFASALLAREHGLRSVSVDDAVCIVPRTTSVRAEYRRKIRTMARGLETLWYKRHLLNPFRHGLFAFMLLSHKLCRWLVYVTLPLSLLALSVAASSSRIATALLGALVLGIAIGAVGMLWPEGRRAPYPIALAGFILASNVAGLVAWRRAIGRQRSATWEPTRRPA